MNTALIGELVKLRYKLLWAKTRSRNGRIALFLAGYLLLVMLIALLAIGRVRRRHARRAQRQGASRSRRRVLTALFLEAVLASQHSGLRHERRLRDTGTAPLSARPRRSPPDAPSDRHRRSLLVSLPRAGTRPDGGALRDWARAASGSGSSPCCCCLSPTICWRAWSASFVDQLMQRKGGAPILLVLIMSLSFLPSVVAPRAREASASSWRRSCSVCTTRRRSARPPR